MIAGLAEEFADPRARHRPMMFWVWNGVVTREGIEAGIADLREQGVGGFFIHPMGERFRLHDFLEGITPPYLSDEYFELVRYAVEQAAAAGLYAWLYDEGGWPSGTAQGKVVDSHPEFRGRVLTALRAVAGQPCPEGAVATVVLRPGALPEVVPSEAPLPTGAEGLHFVSQVGGYPVDLLDPAAVRRFIEVTHERYRECVGDHFGCTIPGIFTDEPSVGGRVGTGAIPWTSQMSEAFRSDHGFDLRPWLPLLFAPEALGLDPGAYYPPGALMAVRCAYFDTWTRLYREAYWDQLNGWCLEHGLLHVGHVGGEDELPQHLAGGFGEFFRTAGTLDVPGVDTIWRQLWPGQANPHFPRLAASAAHQRCPDGSPADWPRAGLALTESFGVYGFGLTFRHMKWVTDYQFARGVNVLCPMARYLWTDRGRLYGTLSHWGPGNPLWEHYRPFADYVGRLSVLCRAGSPVAGIALYYPIETLWAGQPGNASGSFETLCGLLEDQQLEFDVLGSDALLAAEVDEELLVTPGAQYDLLIVPEMSVLRGPVARKLRDFRDGGGRLVFLGDGPKWVAEGAATRPLAEAAPELLDGAYVVDLPKEHDRLVAAFGGNPARERLMQMDGLSAGYFAAPWLDRYAGRRLQAGVVLRVPGDNLGPFAKLMGLTATRVRLSPVQPLEGVRLMTRVLEQTSLHLVVNERDEDAECRFVLTSETPLRLETWDPRTGRRAVVAHHEEITEATEARVSLAPFGSVFLVAMPPEQLAEPEEAPRPALPLTEHLTLLGQLDQFVGLEGPRPLAGWEIRDGALVPCRVLPAVPTGRRALEAGRWDLAPECEHFSGTMAYRVAFRALRDWIERPIFLELREVWHVAELWVNGQPAGRSLWPPHEFDLTNRLREGANELEIRVTNTLANQARREDVIREAKERGWWNVYCERALPMLEEGLPSGMDPWVSIWLGE